MDAIGWKENAAGVEPAHWNGKAATLTGGLAHDVSILIIVGRRVAPISAAPGRERDEHLQPQSDHDGGAVLVSRHAAASPRSGGRGLARQSARETATGAVPR